MSTEAPHDLKQLADQLRSKSSWNLDLFSLVRAAQERNIPFDLEQLRRLLPRRTEFAEYYTQGFIANFITSYLADHPPQSVLDPVAGVGGILSAIVNRYQPHIAIGIDINEGVQQIARAVHGDAPITWMIGDALLLMPELQQRFDVVIADPPIGMMPIERTSADGYVRVRDSVGNLIILQAAELLNENGVGFFIVPPNFMFTHGSRSVRANLECFGLYIDAALSLPAGTFAPLTQIEGLLIIVRRTLPEKLFVGELTDDPTAQSVLLDNLKSRSPGRVPQLGALVEPETFYSFSALLAQREMEELTRTLALQSQPLTDLLAEDIHLSHSRDEEGFQDSPNAVYLPLIGNSSAVASLADLHIKQHNYAQLVFDPSKANAVYVANFLNTPLGYKIRESLLSGVHIPKITKATLRKASLPLPDTGTQAHVIGINTRITELQTTLETLRRALWENPRNARNVEYSVTTLNQEDDFCSWLDTLPFPLASILWTYYAAKTSEMKVEHLLHFFEAYAQWTAVVLLSGFRSDLTFCEQEGVNIQETNPEYYKSYKNASFGTWTAICQRLAKSLRRLTDDESKRIAVLDMFGSPDESFVKLLSGKKVYTILDEIRIKRNEWKGHGGISNRRDAQSRLVILEDYLARIRQLIAERYKPVTLLSPRSARFSEGIYSNTARKLTGSRTPFQEALFDTQIPLDTKKLYLLHNKQLKPNELLPFVRMMRSPATQQNACYFYNRLDNGEVRWVSYHFEMEAELRQPDKELEAALALLIPLSPEGATL